MKPPILQTAWHNQVFCPPSAPGTGGESFVLVAVAPDGRAALWLDFRLVQAAAGRAGASFAEVAATWVAAGGAPPRTIRERRPAAQVGVDPERAGVGIGECVLGEGHTSGRVADAQGAITWDLRWAPQAPYLPAGGRPPDGRAPHLAHAWCAGAGAHSAAHVSGRVELWPGHGRHLTPHLSALAGWQALQTHRWHGPHGRQEEALPLMWMWATAAPDGGQPGARLVAVALPAGGMWGRRQVLLARLWQGTRVWQFDTAAELKRAATSELTPLAWSFTARGPEASLTCRLDLPATSPPAEVLTDAAGEPATRLLAHVAGLEVELCPQGAAPERLRFTQAACEQILRRPARR